jgi:hypothetical protein
MAGPRFRRTDDAEGLKHLITAAAATMLVSGCGSSTPLLSNTYPAPEALAAAVVDAVERRDAQALRSLALSEQEFREHVWPELPSARPERNLPFSYVWGDLRQKSEASLALTLTRHGGRKYTVVAVRNAGDTTRYPSYSVHRDTVLRIRDEAGAPADVRLFGSMIQKDGGWKVFSYVVDE